MKQETQERVNTALQGILQDFESGRIADVVALATFPGIDVPMGKWSLLNRLIALRNGTSDARGYRQWQEAGRQVKKGTRAFHILGPRLVKDKREADGKDSDSVRLVGFVSIPVFAVEDTEGDDLPYQQIELPPLPLLDVAQSWGVQVKAAAFQGGFLGFYRPDSDSITLASPEEKVFFHELSHAAHQRVLRERGESLKCEQDWRQEIVAELSAAVLCRLAGRSEKDTSGRSYHYIAMHAKQAGKDVLKACASVIGDVEKVLLKITVAATAVEQAA